MVVNVDEDFRHLEPAFRRYAALPEADRIAWVQTDRWIAFDQAQAAIDRLDALLAYPPRDRMPCLLIYGATGMGKTKILRKFERRHPPKLCQISGVTLRPVVVAQIPPEPVERDLYREMLASLQAPALAGGSLAREKDVCRALLRSAGVRMIVLDEVNGMLVGTYRQQRIFLNALRFLANDLKVPLVCAGTDLARQALLTDAQLAERFEAFALKPWSNGATFSRLLQSLASILPLRKPSDIDNAAVRERVLALTDGVTARIFRLIETTAVTAIQSGRESLDLASFSGDELILPLVSMTQAAERRAGRAGSLAARR
jgi:Bacterial TniB protein